MRHRLGKLELRSATWPFDRHVHNILLLRQVVIRICHAHEEALPQVHGGMVKRIAPIHQFQLRIRQQLDVPLCQHVPLFVFHAQVHRVRAGDHERCYAAPAEQIILVACVTHKIAARELAHVSNEGVGLIAGTANLESNHTTEDPLLQRLVSRCSVDQPEALADSHVRRPGQPQRDACHDRLAIVALRGSQFRLRDGVDMGNTPCMERQLLMRHRKDDWGLNTDSNRCLQSHRRLCHDLVTHELQVLLTHLLEHHPLRFALTACVFDRLDVRGVDRDDRQLVRGSDNAELAIDRNAR